MQLNHSIFFPQDQSSVPTYILSVFIAWINLDLGIETCFAENLNAYTRSWLQFVFPVYIWLLVALLIVISRYSIRVSRLTGSNTVSVLATLFLLSYAKLLRTTFNSFASTTLTDSTSNSTSVWLLDGNFMFLQYPHILLFIAGLVMLLIHLLPFTLLLTLAPLLQAHSHYKLLRWVNRIMPLLDAYQGPYKIKYRYWTGLMLVVRLLLLSVFAGNVLGDPRINLLVIIITITLLLLLWLKVGRIYRNKVLNAVELFFHANLLLLSTVFLYIKSSSASTTLSGNIPVWIMVGGAFVMFVCILSYHGYTEVAKLKIGKRLISKVKQLHSYHWTRKHRQESQDEEGDDSGVTLQPVNLPTMSVVEITKPLIETENGLDNNE